MATYTTNLNLKKPAQSDKIRIADINNNMDDIDAAFGAIGNDPVATQIGNIQGALAIVAVGDSHAAVTAGQFVYVRSHETLDAGLYVASSNIAENGALSLSNLTADSSGGLNALNSNLASKATIEQGSWTPTFYGRDTASNLYARWDRIGNILFITAQWTNTHVSGSSLIEAASLPTVTGKSRVYGFHGTWKSNQTDSGGEIGQYDANGSLRFSKSGSPVELPNEPISFNAFCFLSV